jgi:hypothetical protein
LLVIPVVGLVIGDIRLEYELVAISDILAYIGVAGSKRLLELAIGVIRVLIKGFAKVVAIVALARIVALVTISSEDITRIS